MVAWLCMLATAHSVDQKGVPWCGHCVRAKQHGNEPRSVCVHRGQCFSVFLQTSLGVLQRGIVACMEAA